jgi:hypothetical protein
MENRFFAITLKSWLKLGVAAVLCYWFFVGLLTPAIAQTISPKPPTATITPRQENIGDKIKEKIQEIKSTLRVGAYVGEVTDKTETSMTISTKQGLKQVIVGSSVKVINQKTGSTRKDVKPEDIAIGDYVLAMGSIESTNGRTLTAKRIVIVTKPEVKRKEALMGVVTEVSKNNLKIESVNRGEWSVNIDSSTKVSQIGSEKAGKITDLELQDKILAIGVLDKEKEIDAQKIVILTLLPSPTPKSQ